MMIKLKSDQQFFYFDRQKNFLQKTFKAKNEKGPQKTLTAKSK